MSTKFLIHTLSSRGSLLKSEIWNSEAPFGFGCPFQWVLEKTDTGIRVWNLGKNVSQDFKENEAFTKALSLEQGFKIRLSKIKKDELELGWKSSHIENEPLDLTQEEKTFKNASIASFSALVVLLITSSIAPMFKPKEEALIPAQFAKIILSAPVNHGKTASRKADDGAGAKRPNLLQAFKSTEVQKSTQKLLKGGVLQLLAQSEFAPNRKPSSVINNLFDKSKSTQLAALGTKMAADSQPVNVATLGGGGNGNGNSVGYGKGEKAGVEGQGNSFVSLDTFDSVVEEGLSKDEVGKVIHSHLAEVRYCYESAMIKNPSVQGKLVADFVIQGTGNVKVAKINSSSVGDAFLNQCIIDHLYKWKFPKPKGGIEVAVAYPFIFKSLGK